MGFIQKETQQLFLVPGLAVVIGDPHFAVGGRDPAVLRIGKLNAVDIAGEHDSGRDRQNPSPVRSCIRRMIERRTYATRPDFWTNCRNRMKNRCRLRS